MFCSSAERRMHTERADYTRCSKYRHLSTGCLITKRQQVFLLVRANCNFSLNIYGFKCRLRQRTVLLTPFSVHCSPRVHYIAGPSSADVTTADCSAVRMILDGRWDMSLAAL